MVERVLSDFGRAYGLRSVSLRYFNAAGADPEGEIGERHQPETHIIPLAIEAARDESEFILTIFGKDFDTPDGTCVRDFIHVQDLAEAHLGALDYLQAAGDSCTLNLGTGRGHSVLEIVSAVTRVSGQPVRHAFGPRREGDPPILIAAPKEAGDLLRWSARRSDLDSIVADALGWVRIDAQRQSMREGASR
jgi:UDP-glucose 4-epimerase